jgi:hypothetical protein
MLAGGPAVRRKLMLAAIVAVAMVAVAAASALIGAAGGQAPGSLATGQLRLLVRATDRSSHNGTNPAVPRDKSRPKISDLLASNQQLLDPATRAVIGGSGDFDVVLFNGPPTKKYRGGAIVMENVMLYMGNFRDQNYLFLQCVERDGASTESCGVSSGTGRFAGARGSAFVDFRGATEDRKNHTFTFKATITFT